MRVLLLQPLTLLSRRVAEWHHVKMENDSRHESLPDDKQAARQTQRITNDTMMMVVIICLSHLICTLFWPYTTPLYQGCSDQIRLAASAPPRSITITSIFLLSYT